MDPESLKNHPFVLIRHGLSKFNLKALIAKEEHGPDSEQFQAVEKDPEGYDPELHDIGILQCQAHQEVINSIDWKVVFTSPMQRAMMTTIHMFKNHPNKNNI